MYRMGTVGIVCILEGWVCSVGTLVCSVGAHVFILVCFVYILTPVGVACIYGGSVCPGCRALYGILRVVWILRSMYAWV